jgi:hypothetical protein
MSDRACREMPRIIISKFERHESHKITMAGYFNAIVLIAAHAITIRAAGIFYITS